MQERDRPVRRPGESSACAILRRWTTGVAPGRTGDYERFALARSLPMFRDAPGCLGVCMSGHSSVRSVTTMWIDADHLAAFEQSQKYRETVSAMVSSGCLTGTQSVTLEPSQLCWFSSEAVAAVHVWNGSD